MMNFFDYILQGLSFIFPNLIKVLLLFFLSFSFRLILESTGQRWIKTTSHTTTLTLLPTLTFFITKLISGNIALSLGMVGALSIIRFRNPVKSPLELTIYFASITMGIAAAVNIKWLISLTLSIYMIVFLLIFLSYISREIFQRELFITSFSEGNPLSSLEVTASKKISLLEESNCLKSIHSFDNGQKQYLLVSNEFNLLKRLIIEIENNDHIIEYQLNE